MKKVILSAVLALAGIAHAAPADVFNGDVISANRSDCKFFNIQ